MVYKYSCSHFARRVFIDGTACSQDLDVVIHPTTHGCPSYHANMLVGHTSKSQLP